MNTEHMIRTEQSIFSNALARAIRETENDPNYNNVQPHIFYSFDNENHLIISVEMAYDASISFHFDENGKLARIGF